MDLYTSLAELPADFGPSAVTIGKFDGVHLGHRSVIDAVDRAALERGLTSVALTFDRNPLALLRPELCPISITSNNQKQELLADAGVDAMLMLEFTDELSHESPEDFVTGTLVDGLHAKLVFVGETFRFGHRGAGTTETLRELGALHGFEVVPVEEFEVDGAAVSSTRVRDLLDAGDIDGAALLLGRLPSIRGLVVHGLERGRQLGYPTANLSPDLEGFIPADGVYAAWLKVDGKRMPAAVSIGNNPTFDGVPDKQVEAHVLDATLDLYDRVVELEFVAYIRGMRKFSGPDALAAQMAGDELDIREILRLAAA